MPSATPSHDEITRAAEQLWIEKGRPSGVDNQIWLEAERKLSTPPPAKERVIAETASESVTENLVSPPVSNQQAVKIALQSSPAPKAPAKKAVTPAKKSPGKR